MTKRRTKAEREFEQRIDRAVGRALAGRTIDVLKIGKVYQVARLVGAAGGDAESAADAAAAFYADPREALAPNPLESSADAAGEWDIDARMAERAGHE